MTNMIRKDNSQPGLSPTGLLNANPSLRKHNFLDPNAALGVVPHPSDEWVGLEFQPCKPRDTN